MSPGKVMKAPTIGFLADPRVFFMSVTLLIVYWAAALQIIITIELGKLPTDNDLGLEIMFGSAAIIGTVVHARISPQWAGFITLSEDGIRYGSIFKRRPLFSYKDFPLVYRASYIHGLVGAPNFGPEIVYIILSKRRLTEIEKNNINEVAASEELIKIKYSKKRYAQLMEILPPNLSSQLNAVFLAYRKPDDLALRRSAITAKARRRKKQKRK